MLIEGAPVTYIGPATEVATPGAAGRLLSVSGDGGHVLFSTGKAAGRVDFVPLVTLSAVVPVEPSLIADALDAPEALSSTAVRQTVATAGEQGLVAALAEAGVLDELASIGEEAADLVSARVRSDPALHPVMAVLDIEEQDQVVALTSALLLRAAANQDGTDDD